MMRYVLELAARWAALLAAEPALSQFEGAERLGVTELELVAAQVSSRAVRLQRAWPRLLRQLHVIGNARAHTPNAFAWIESRVRYAPPTMRGGVALVRDPPTELALRLPHFHLGFGITEDSARGPLRSLQFFTAGGSALHKIFVGREGPLEEFDAVVIAHASRDQRPGEQVEPARTSAYELGEPIARAPTVIDEAAVVLLQRAITERMPLELRVENRGVAHVFSGRLDQLEPHAERVLVRGRGVRFELSDAFGTATVVGLGDHASGGARLQLRDARGTSLVQIGSAAEADDRFQRWLVELVRS